MIPNKKSSVFYLVPELWKKFGGVAGRPAGGFFVTIEHFQFEMLRISNHTACRFAEKRGFSALFGPGDAVPPPRVSPFSKLKRPKKRGAPRQRRASVGRGGKHRHGNSGVSRWKVCERRMSERLRDQGSNPGAPVLPCAARLSGSHPDDRNIFSLKRVAFQTMRPVALRKSVVFPLARAGRHCAAASRFAFMAKDVSSAAP